MGVRAARPALGTVIAALACLVGSFAALALTGITLNISSFMGIIMVAGITAKNGILLLDRAEHGVASGGAPAEALADAAIVRLRPIVMTTLATAAGLLPLALGYGAGAKVQQPLAVAVIGGLVLADAAVIRDRRRNLFARHAQSAARPLDSAR